MIKLTVYYTDGDKLDYIYEKVRYDARVIFAEINGGKRICIPYANVYIVIEKVTE